ncbi:MAG TPA: hypothetical protein VFO81_15180, partial [Gaiellaceae bacterium]|nr:hypothetical protein [Gaiellaceae bacterium]
MRAAIARAEAPEPGPREGRDERLEGVTELGGGGPVGRPRLEGREQELGERGRHLVRERRGTAGQL